MTRSFRFCSITLLASVPIVAGQSVSAQVVEGDRQLLDVVLAAQETNRTAWPQGAMSATVRTVLGPEKSDVEAELVWKGQETYWKYRRAAESPSGKDTSGGELIHSGQKRIFYSKTNRTAQLIESDHFSLREELKIRPPDHWLWLESLVPFRQLLDPSKNEEAVLKYVVRKDGDDTIVVERHLKTPGPMVTFRFSLEYGGNLTSYETFLTAPGPWREGRYRWEKHPSGTTFLKRLESKRSLVGDPKLLDRHITIDVTSYDPVPKIPHDRFTLASLKLPDDTTIEELGADGRVLRQRKPPRPVDRISQEDLESLIEAMRQGRFARPRSK